MPQNFPEHPHDVFRRNIWVSPFWEGCVSDVVNTVGWDKVLFGSDYPHPEGLAEPKGFWKYAEGMDDAAHLRLHGRQRTAVHGTADRQPGSVRDESARHGLYLGDAASAAFGWSTSARLCARRRTERRPVSMLAEHSDPGTGERFSPDGRFLAYGCWKSQIASLQSPSSPDNVHRLGERRVRTASRRAISRPGWSRRMGVATAEPRLRRSRR